MTNSQDQEFAIKLAKYAKAISNPSRMNTMLFLAEHEELTFGEINERLTISKATLSQHLNELKAANLIIGRKEGQNTFYSINEEGWCDFKLLFDSFTANCPCDRHGTANALVSQWKLANPSLVTPEASCCCCGSETSKKSK